MNKATTLRTLPACLAMLLFAGREVSAAMQLYDDRAAFVSASGATSPGPVPTGGGADLSFVIGGLSFTCPLPSSFYLRPPDIGNLIPGLDVAINDVEQFNVECVIPLYAFGFDFHEPQNNSNIGAPFIDSEFTITVFSQGSSLGSVMFSRPNDTLEFIGVSSSNPFDRIVIRETIGGIDNEFFGNFLTGHTAFVYAEADFDEDGDVDGDDLTRWRNGFGTGATHMQGDADGDADVDGSDFLTWQRQLGSGAAIAAAIPEPATLAMLCLGMLAVPRRPRLAVSCNSRISSKVPSIDRCDTDRQSQELTPLTIHS